MKSLQKFSLRQWYFLLVIIGSVLIIVGSVTPLPGRTSSLLAVHFLDIGQGDAAYVDVGNNTTVLIDGGPNNKVLAELGRFIPWWRHRIDYIVVSHPDSDHFAGLLGVIEKYDIGEVIYNGDIGDSRFNLLLSMIEKRHIQLVKASAGDMLWLAPDTHLEFLWPPPQFKGNSKNARSLVALLLKGESSFLFTGDLPLEEEAELMKQHPLLTIDVLKVGHHGSKYSSSLEFLRQIHASFCVISVGADNSYGHPAKRVLDDLGKVACQVFITMKQGTISFLTDGAEVRFAE